VQVKLVSKKGYSFFGQLIMGIMITSNKSST